MEDYAHWYSLGNQRQRAGDWVGALDCYQRAVRLNRQAVQAWCDLATVLQHLGRTSAAKQSWSEALRWQPNALAARMGLGQLALDAGEWESAVAHFRAALERDHRNTAPAVGLAEAQLGLGARDEAVARLRDVLAREPGRLAAWRACDAALRAQGDEAAANRLYRQQASALPAHPAVWAAAMRAALDAGEDALPFLAEAVGYAWTESDQETLREILLLAGEARLRDAAVTRLRQIHGEIASQAIEKSGPLCWPRRLELEGDARLRVMLLGVLSNDAALYDCLAGMAADRVAVSLCWLSQEPLPSTLMRALEPLGARVFRAAGLPPGQIARLVADSDPDWLVDCAGLAVPAAGGILALQPARRRVALPDRIPSYSSPLVTHALVAAGEAAEAGLSVIARTRGWWEGISASVAVPAPALLAAWQRAIVAHRARDDEAAREAYAEVLALQPESAAARFMFGSLLAAASDGNARTHLGQALDAAPAFTEARLALVDRLLAERRSSEALQASEAGLSLRPSSSARAALERVRGLALMQQGDARAALGAFRASLLLEPADALSHYNFGVALQAAGEPTAAASSYQRALVLAPDMIDARFNLAVQLQLREDFEAAATCYQQVLQQRPAHVAAWKNLGECLYASRRYDAWLANFRQFERACPRALPLAVQALQVLPYAGDMEGVERYLDGLRREEFAAADERELLDSLEELLYLLLYFDFEPPDLATFYRTYDEAAKHIYGTPMELPPERRPGRLRIGYLSGDLRDHVMGKMMLPVLESHDTERFEIFCYSLSPQDDAVTARYREVAPGFRSLAALSDADAVAMIAADDLDLLVDLSTHTKGARPAILARKPARLQLTHVASAGAVGLSAVDFKLTDAWCDVPANQEWLIERLLAMDTGCYPFRRVACAEDHSYQRERFGIASGAVVIGAFVSLLKLSRRCLVLWREALAQIPEAVIALSPQDPSLNAHYARLFREAGIIEKRLVFLPQSRDEEENLARYALVDFVLDPMPYGGVNGTMEALSMHVPVVTLCGRQHSERTSTSILQHVGVPETVATSGSEYVALAVRLAREPSFRSAVRERIRNQLAHSQYVDPRHYTRSLERAYLAAMDAGRNGARE
jgi:predicted O-linked N-acetylglucosamine transferase (SPINDLY family)